MELICNDILCYISTSRHEKAHDDIVIIVQGFYDHQKIRDAKDFLYKLCKKRPTRRKIFPREIEDILEAFEDAEKESISLPKFVTDRYDSLPPSSGFEAVARNMSFLRETVENLNEELKEMRESRDSFVIGLGDVADLKAEISDIKKKLITMEHTTDNSCSQKTNPTFQQAPTFSEIVQSQARELNFYRNPMTQNVSGAPKNLFSTANSTGGGKQTAKAKQTNNHSRADSRRNNNIYGTSNVQGGLMGANRKMDLYLGRCIKETSLQTVKDHIKDICKVSIDNVEELTTKSLYYKSFKITTSYNDRQLLLNPQLWPEGVIVRKFFKHRNYNVANNANNESFTDATEFVNNSLVNQ